MGRVLYGHYSDNVAPLATASVGAGSADPDYPATNLNDLVVARPAQLSTTTGAFVFSFLAAQRVDLVALPHHNLSAGLEVRIQANPTDTWGAPAFNRPITIPPYRKDGLPPGAWLNLTTQAGYDVGGWQYWRVAIVGVNHAPVKLTEVVLLSTIRTLNPNISWGARRPERRPLIENETDYGVQTVYDLGVTHRQLEGDIDTTDAGLAAVSDWWQDCRGRARPCLLIPDESVNDAWFVRWATELDPTLVITDRNTIPVGFKEISKGLIL